MPPAMSSTARKLLALSVSLSMATVLSGCGIGAIDHSTSGSLALKGIVHGGQQPVAGATIHLYASGTSGLASPATDMLNVTTPGGVVHYVTSDSGGNFSITGDYSCAHSTDQVYIVASGGNPGLAANTNNQALVMMDTLGACGTLLANAATEYITINEVTTVAAAWALAPFMTSATNVGATSTNSRGIANAFLNAQLLANSGTGVATTLASNLTTETGKLYALADVIATCINSDGTAACTPLFTAATPTGGAAPTDTLTAALNIVKNPGQHVGAIFNLVTPQTPFITSLLNPPSDWTMSLTVTGGGLYEPTQLQLDSLSNVWVADYPGAVSAFNPQGAPYSPATGFITGSTNLQESLGLGIDDNNNVWVTSEEAIPHGTTAGSAAVFFGASSSTLGLYGGTVFDNSINFPESMASDSNGDILIGNFPSGSVTVYNDSGSLVSPGLGFGNGSFVSAVTADGSHGIWMANQGDGPNGTITHVDASGNLLSRPVCCNGSNGIGRDVSGNVWVSNYYGLEVNGAESTSGSLSEVSNSGTVLLNQTVTGGGVYRPGLLNLDASQTVWVVNFRGESFSEIAGSASTLTAGTPISPSTGYGLDANLQLPYSIVPDTSGNLWISSFGNNKLTMFFGLATPTVTPAGPTPLAP
jgi:hypothetical protein